MLEKAEILPIHVCGNLHRTMHVIVEIGKMWTDSNLGKYFSIEEVLGE